MLIDGFEPFVGQHCETTATGNLLKYAGLNLSEPMLFGLGEGLGFIYWDMRTMALPFLGGRIKPQQITKNLALNLHLQASFQETASVRTAWKNVQSQIDSGIPVGLQLDCYYLEYFGNPIHFAGHYVAMYGYDDTFAYLIDTQQQGGAVKSALENLEQARNAKGPMAAKNLSYTIAPIAAAPNLAEVIRPAIQRNAEEFLNPAIANFGYKGIAKASQQVKSWFTRSKNIREDLTLVAVLIERGGTGGALFRNMYRDFLSECREIINDPNLTAAHDLFCRIAPQWSEVASLLTQAGETTKQCYLDQASVALLDLSKQEKEAMGYLAQLAAASRSV